MRKLRLHGNKKGMICRCGDIIKDMQYCPKCKAINFGNRTMQVVGGFKPKHHIKKDN